MLKYNPQNFKQLYETPLGDGLWQFLNKPDSLIRMETAAQLRRPPLEAISPYLIGAFGEKALAPLRVKQMVGHMVRQVMENNGYCFDAGNVLCRSSTLFSRASRYKKKAAPDIIKV